MKPLNVYRDVQSGVIYIDDFYIGEETYRKGEYLEYIAREGIVRTDSLNDERRAEVSRQAKAYNQLFVGQEIAEFGCGPGDFLRRIQSEVSSCYGVELQEDYVNHLNSCGIKCYTTLDDLDESSLDVIFSFHVLEHLPEPLATLSLMKKKLKRTGRIVVEVPHASDFLLSKVSCDAFKKFTLWSHHLVLHTQYSLTRLLERAGFHDITIEGVQRYPLSNHLQWLAKGLPGGHQSELSSLDTDELTTAYVSALKKIDATDTLTAIAY
jgi:2-polyprenyl-3-methyl-5-hydroxy-6-metoxy-1,4-benzoquinol methylase